MSHDLFSGFKDLNQMFDTWTESRRQEGLIRPDNKPLYEQAAELTQSEVSFDEEGTDYTLPDGSTKTVEKGFLRVRLVKDKYGNPLLQNDKMFWETASTLLDSVKDV